MRNILWVAVGVGAISLAGGGCIINSTNAGTGGAGSTHAAGTDTSSTSSYMASGPATTGTGAVNTCNPDAMDNGCVACEKTSCCNEIMACDNDATCAKTYGDWYDCLFPSGGNGNPSGYTSNYCEAAVNAKNTAAGALIECISSKCSDASACGSDSVTWTNFAAKFVEDFCDGCHFPGFSAPSGKSVPTDIPQFTDDGGWPYWNCPNTQDCQSGPESFQDWNTPGVGVSYDEVTQVMASASFPANDKVPDKIWCGVSVQLPSECAMEFPGKFPNAERFPPAGTDPTKAQCAWTNDLKCPQPTDEDRNRMASWIFDGMPK